MTKTRKRTTPAMIQRAYELASRGWHHEKIAIELGNSPSCVSRILVGTVLPKVGVILTAAQLAELPEKYRKTPRRITASPGFRHCFTCKATYRTAEEARRCYKRHEDQVQAAADLKKDQKKAPAPIGQVQVEAEGREISKVEAPEPRDELEIVIRIRLEIDDQTTGQLRLRLAGGGER